MKKSIKLFALLLTFAMLLSGCSDGGSGSSSSSGGGGSSKKSSDKTQTAQNTAVISGGEQCDWCNGSGLCRVCKGNKECGMCDGSGLCNVCDGDPSSRYGGRCSICGSSGKCKYCTDGVENCVNCRGLGVCENCRGQHTMDCNVCIDGYKYKEETVYLNPNPTPNPNPNPDPNPNPGDEYICPSCNNSGYETCIMCSGSGLCINCMGTGYYETTSMGEIVQMDCNACNKGVCSRIGICVNEKNVI